MAFLDKIHPLLKRTRQNKYSDNNYAILNAIDKQLEEMELETIQSKSQSAIYTATGWFLDNAWGKWFGVKRKTGESDSDYRDRIIEKVNIPRGTVESVKYGIREFLENEYVGIEIYEPWEDIFYLNRVESRLNGKHHLIGEYYNYGVMDITVGETFPKDMLDVIDLFKPAGVTVHVNVDLNLPSNDPNAEKDLLSTHKLNVYDSYKEYERTVGMFEGIMGKFSIFDKVNVVEGKDFILRNGYVYGYLADEAVERGHEFFKPSEAQANTMLNADNGLEYSEQGSAISGAIPVKPNTELISNYPIEVISVYDKKGNFLSSIIDTGNSTPNKDNTYKVDISEFWDRNSNIINQVSKEGRNLLEGSERIKLGLEDRVTLNYLVRANIISIANKVKVGDTLTFSFDLWSEKDTPIMIYDSNGNPNMEFGKEDIEATSTKKRFSFTRKLKSSNDNNLNNWYMDFYNLDNGIKYWVENIKIEKGETATPWTPAPEDYDVNIKVGYKNAPSNLADISIKEPDYSLFNNRMDLIRGNTETLNDYEHVVGVGTDFNPSPNFRLQDLDEHTTIKEPTDLSLPNNNLGYIYTVFDLSHFYTNHKDKIIKNDRYSYIDYLSNNNFTLSLNGENGRTFEVEYYNFLNKEWELLERNIFKENTIIVSKQIDMHKALNDNLVIIIRVKTFNKQVTIEDMYLEYRYSKELPISVTGSNTGHSITLSFEENNGEGDLDYPKTPLVDKARVDEDIITE